MRSIIFASIVSSVVAGRYSADNDKSHKCPDGTSSTDYGETCVEIACPAGSTEQGSDCICQDGTTATEVMLHSINLGYANCVGWTAAGWNSGQTLKLHLADGSEETLGTDGSYMHSWCSLKVKRCLLAAEWGTPFGDLAAPWGVYGHTWAQVSFNDPAPQKYSGYVADECTTKAKDEYGNDLAYMYKCDGGGEEPYIYREGWTGNPEPGEIFFTTCDDLSLYDAAAKKCAYNILSSDCTALQTAYKNNCACTE